MKDFLMDAYEFLSVFLPFLFVSFVLRKRHKLSRGVTSVPYGWTILALFYLVYIAAMFSLTGTGTLFDIRSYGITLRPNQINLIPFSHTIDLVGYLQNVLLFLPFGFFCPSSGRKQIAFGMCCLPGLSFHS